MRLNDKENVPCGMNTFTRCSQLLNKVPTIQPQTSFPTLFSMLLLHVPPTSAKLNWFAFPHLSHTFFALSSG